MHNELRRGAEHVATSSHHNYREFTSDGLTRKCNAHDIINTLKGASNEQRGDMWLELIRAEHGKEVFRTLLISKGNQTLKMEALLAIQLMGEDGITVMKDAFRRGDSWTRSQLVGIFAFLRTDTTISELVQAVDDTTISTEKRLLALNALANCSAVHEERIIKLLDSKDVSVRSRIARIVGQRGFEKGRQKLKRMLMEEKDLGVLYSVIEALNSLGESLTIEEVMNLREGNLRDKRSVIRKMKEIAKRYGSRMYALVLALVSVFMSLGYTLAGVSSLLNMIVKSRAGKSTEVMNESEKAN